MHDSGHPQKTDPGAFWKADFYAGSECALIASIMSFANFSCSSVKVVIIKRAPVLTGVFMIDDS